jgi:muramoyltetrapeptide carboxypeptidase LdcA involved in peptidoglycan recycling
MLDWDEKLDLTRPRELRESDGWIAIRAGTARGPLFGGCLETICWHVKGSDAWMTPEGAILLLEASEEAPPPAHVDSYLTDLEQLGVFDAAVGLLVARPMNYGEDDRQRLWEVVERRTEAAGLPVLADVEAGHTDPMVTLPFGVPAELDAGGKRLGLLEAPTRA